MSWVRWLNAEIQSNKGKRVSLFNSGVQELAQAKEILGAGNAWIRLVILKVMSGGGNTVESANSELYYHRDGDLFIE